jgi:hypothetical protein
LAVVRLCTAMVLFAAVTIPTDIQHALNSHQPLDWAAPAVVYAALMALRRFLLHTVAIAVIGSVVLMADGMAYPLTLPALFCALYSVALGSGPGRPAPGTGRAAGGRRENPRSARP